MSKVSVFDGINEHWEDLQENIYLHTLEKNYKYASQINPYQYIQVKIQDNIWNQLIKQQENREMLLFQLLEINVNNSTEGAKKLSEWIETGGGFNDYLNKSNDNIRDMIEDLVTQAIEESDYNLNSTASTDALSNVYNNVEKILQKKLDNLQGNYNKEIVEKFIDREKYTSEAAKDIASALRKYDQKRKTLIYDNLESYTNSLKKSSALSDFKGFALENAISLGLSAVFQSVKGKDITVNTSGKKLLNGKQQKADATISFNSDGEELTWGMSMKNYPINKTGRVNIKLQDESSLDNFLHKLENTVVLKNINSNKLKKISSRFIENNNFKYHLINETLFNNYDPNNTEAGKNVLELIKQSLFYFIGAEFLKAPEVVNNDFMVIGTTFIPVSDIMKNIGNLKINFNPKLKNPKKINKSMYTILAEKQQDPVETSSDFYGENAMTIGSNLGKELWKTIQLNRVMISLNIKDYM